MTVIEHMFDTRVMLTSHDITGLRRSLAMAPLSRDETERLLDSCEQMARERSKIRTVLDNLPTTVRDLRQSLNDLQRLVADQ